MLRIEKFYPLMHGRKEQNCVIYLRVLPAPASRIPAQWTRAALRRRRWVLWPGWAKSWPTTGSDQSPFRCWSPGGESGTRSGRTTSAVCWLTRSQRENARTRGICGKSEQKRHETNYWIECVVCRRGKNPVYLEKGIPWVLSFNYLVASSCSHKHLLLDELLGVVADIEGWIEVRVGGRNDGHDLKPLGKVNLGIPWAVAARGRASSRAVVWEVVTAAAQARVEATLETWRRKHRNLFRDKKVQIAFKDFLLKSEFRHLRIESSRMHKVPW